MTHNGLPQLPRLVPRELTPEQERRQAEVTARSKAIQAVGPKPLDGVTFGKKPGK